ncbi:hypothetical protein PAXRUDRAFT_84432, partial [Paxillus rubicundulus Ve08.2h10]
INQMLSLLTNTMLEESRLPKSFWADAMAMAAYITTQSPMSALHGENPYQTLFCQHINPTIFCPFAYKLLDVKCHTIISNWHITFDETGTISTHNLAPWNVPTVERQWEGLLPRQHKAEHEDTEEE